jgi:hypothetical protein
MLGQAGTWVCPAVPAGFKGIDTACQPKHYREDLVGAALANLKQARHPCRFDAVYASFPIVCLLAAK